MVSPHNAAGDDGLSQLFGSVTGDAVQPSETTEAPVTRRSLRSGAAPVVSPLAHAPLANLQPSSAAPLTRREARQATAPVSKARAPKTKTTAAAAAPAPLPQVPRPEVFSYEGIEFPSHPAPQKRAKGTAARRAASLVASAPPVRTQRVGLRKRVSSAATILAVTGFFAAVCIPAYAFGPVDELEAAPADVLASKSDATLSVARDAAELNVARDSFSATTAADLADARSSALKIANFEAYEKSGARELGDDYPWFSELSNNQGGGLSPLNYYYRECVDFVAWRLNRDAGSTSAPFKWDWNKLTPGGGSAYAWKRQWENHGWPTGTTPKVGAVAWFGYHVSYVKSVNSDGTVTIEEYNHQSDHLYGVRTIPATDVTAYLYAPPG